MNRFLLLIFSFLLSLSVCAEGVNHSLSVEMGSLQIKEHENLGMVFSGPELKLGYDLKKSYNRFSAYYSPDISLAGVFRRHITGYSIGFAPLIFGGDYNLIKTKVHTFDVGINTGLRYHWQMYPDFHNAQLFAESEIPLDLRLSYRLNYGANMFAINIRNSLGGFIGQLPIHDPYFYSLSFSEFAINPLKKISFCSFGKYNHTAASICWTPSKIKKHSFGLSLEYLKLNDYQSLSYSIIWCKKF